MHTYKEKINTTTKYIKYMAIIISWSLCATARRNKTFFHKSTLTVKSSY